MGFGVVGDDGLGFGGEIGGIVEVCGFCRVVYAGVRME